MHYVFFAPIYLCYAMRNVLAIYGNHAFSFCDLELLQLAEVNFRQLFPKTQQGEFENKLPWYNRNKGGFLCSSVKNESLPPFLAKLCRWRICILRLQVWRSKQLVKNYSNKTWIYKQILVQNWYWRRQKEFIGYISTFLLLFTTMNKTWKRDLYGNGRNRYMKQH